MNSVANGTRKSRQIVMTTLASALLMVLLPAKADGLIDLGLGSADAANVAGDVVIGILLNNRLAFRWTQATGMVSLGALISGVPSRASAINAAGDVIVGTSEDRIAGPNRAFRWTQATGMVNLGALNGGYHSAAYGVNAAGDVVVGEAQDGALPMGHQHARAFRWTQATGMISLGALSAAHNSRATAVNAAGDVVVGMDDPTGSAERAFRWTQTTGMVDLGVLSGKTTSMATSVNAAGDVVVGVSRNGPMARDYMAFRWTQATGMIALGSLTGGEGSEALSVNPTGDVVVGEAWDGDGGHAFRWTQATGMQTVEQWLASKGVALPSGNSTWEARGINADGTVVVGLLRNVHAFIARAANSFPGDVRIGSGLIDVPEFNMGLMNVSRISSQSVSNTDTALNGHYGTPMLLPEGRYRVWVGGVAGRQSTGRYDASLGLGEFGIAKSLSANTQLNFSIGGNYGKTNTGFGGQTIERNTSVTPELVVRLPQTSLYATVSGYYASGNTDINRGYLNAGTEVQARGKASTYTLAGRLSLDWANAATWLGTDFSPYVSLTHVEHHTGAYTETGGGFPVAWNARTEHATTARLGTGMTHPLNDNLTLLGRAEVAHRFQTTSASVSGQVLGLYGFTLPGENTHQNWMQTGIGLESHMLDGIGSVMLHGSTQGQAPQYWISASYRKTF